MRALLIVLDGAGCGGAPDAEEFGDGGANTLGHIFERVPGLALPALFSLGLWKAVTGDVFDARSLTTTARWGRMRQTSAGKDTVTGHWEIAGATLAHPFAVFSAFPPELVSGIESEARVRLIGNVARSGTEILEEFGAEHLRTGSLILYTSADSVLQIAAHESVLPAARLYEVCRNARRQANAWKIGRVIARPFEGSPGNFSRTAGRHDFGAVPPRTVLNAITEAGLMVHGVGKVKEIFAGSGIVRSTSASSNAAAMAAIDEAWAADDDGLIFANLGDFDSRFGHRRDVAGYANALVEFDAWLAPFLSGVESDDLVIITADHGNDPTFGGSDHTREEVPLLAVFHGETLPLGTRRTFADVAATLSEVFELREPWPVGESFLRETRPRAGSPRRPMSPRRGR